jgi:hypothetical protein
MRFWSNEEYEKEWVYLEIIFRVEFYMMTTVHSLVKTNHPIIKT